MTLTDLDLIRRERAERSLSTFIQQAWQVLEPATPYSHNWHIDAICEHLEAVNRHEIRNLIINISPRCMKSLTVAVFWPVWTWINSPQERWLFATYGQSLTVRDSIKRRNLITSPWYQDRWGDRFRLTRDQNAKVRFENDRTGFMLATSVDGAATGEGGSKLVLDDPLKASDALSELSRTSVNRWWDQTMSTRLNDRKTGARVIIMQRLHEADLVGHLLDKMADGGTEYEHLMLPMEFEPERRCFTSLGFQDPRQEKGELMWPERFDQIAVQELKQDLGSYAAAAQLQQRPAPEGGGLFKDRWWRFWIPYGADVETFGRPHIELPDGSLHWFDVQPLPHARHMQQMQSWDCAFKGKQTSDYVAGLAAGVAYPHIYVMDQVHAKMDIVQTIRSIEQLSDEYPKAHAKLIEDKANGPAVMQLLRDKVHGLLAYNPEGNKVARASALAPIVEAGNVWLPHPKIAPWVWDFIAEFSQFPYAAYDDRVDSLGQLVQWALDRMGRKKKVKARARA